MLLADEHSVASRARKQTALIAALGTGLAVLAGVLLPEQLRALFIAGAANACVAGVMAVKCRPTAG